MSTTRFQLLNDSAPVCSRYRHLTFPSYHSLLENLSTSGPVVALGVTIDEIPVGLVITTSASNRHGQPIARIVSLFVIAAHRRRGLGQALLARIEAEHTRRDCTKLTMEYMGGFNTFALELLLLKNGWTLETVGVTCYASKSKVLTAESPHLLESVGKLSRKLPPDYKVFEWLSMSTRERQGLHERIERDPLYRRYTPFLDEQRIEPINSLGLRHDGQIVGWMITHRTAPHTIRYTRLFSDPDHHPVAGAMYLLAKAIQLHFDAWQVGEDTYATWEFNPDNTQMMKLVQRKLKPYLTDIKNVRVAVKSTQR